MTEPPSGLRISCEQVVELVTDYLEGALDDGLHAEVEAHLSICPGCEEYLEQMRTTIRLLGHVPVETLSETAKSDLLLAFRDFHAPQSEQG